MAGMFISTAKSNLCWAARETHRAVTLLALLTLLALPQMYATAMRVSPIDEYATLVHDGVARLGQQHCIAPAGSTVRVIGRTANPGQPSTRNWLFVRLIDDGPCAGYELTADEGELRNFRATPTLSTNKP